MTRAFLDSNVLVYAFSSDARRDRALALLDVGGRISVQSLNEFANAARRNLRFDWHDVHRGVDAIRLLCGPPLQLDDALQVAGMALAERYRLSVYDGLIVAAALALDCDTLYSEDMHDGLVIDERLRIVNPFAPA